jgi:hypothetical protein
MYINYYVKRHLKAMQNCIYKLVHNGLLQQKVLSKEEEACLLLHLTLDRSK